MKKIITLLLTMSLIFALAACGNVGQKDLVISESDTTIANTSEAENQNEQTASTNGAATAGTNSGNGVSQNNKTANSSASSSDTITFSETSEGSPSETPSASSNVSEPAETAPTTTAPKSKTIVVYFSCTGNTKAVAEKIAELCDAELYEITAAQPYTTEDLNYNNSNCRANREMNDENARPAIGSQTIDLSGYDTVFIGYPIWWGTMPRIINTFLDTYDLSGKTIMPFCTSGGSGVSRSVSDMKKAESKADVRDGLRVSGANDRDLEKWLSDNNIK